TSSSATGAASGCAARSAGTTSAACAPAARRSSTRRSRACRRRPRSTSCIRRSRPRTGPGTSTTGTSTPGCARTAARRPAGASSATAAELLRQRPRRARSSAAIAAATSAAPGSAASAARRPDAVTTAYYRLLTAAGEVIEDDSAGQRGTTHLDPRKAEVKVADGTFVLTPSMGDALRVPFSQIASVAEGESFTLRIGLAQGTVIELSRMGAMRTQVLAELRDAHADAAAQTASAVGEADISTGFAGGEKVELRVYDDALLVIGPAATQRVSFSFVTSVSVADYVVT